MNTPGRRVDNGDAGSAGDDNRSGNGSGDQQGGTGQRTAPREMLRGAVVPLDLQGPVASFVMSAAAM